MTETAATMIHTLLLVDLCFTYGSHLPVFSDSFKKDVSSLEAASQYRLCIDATRLKKTRNAERYACDGRTKATTMAMDGMNATR